MESAFPLSVDETTICLPTDGNAELSWQIGGETKTGTVILKQAFLAGKSYTVTLSYKEELEFDNVIITGWSEVEAKEGEATL